MLDFYTSDFNLFQIMETCFYFFQKSCDVIRSFSYFYNRTVYLSTKFCARVGFLNPFLPKPFVFFHDFTHKKHTTNLTVGHLTQQLITHQK